jgi:hypothetical protein
MSKKLIAALAIGLSASSAVFAGAVVPLVNTLPRGSNVVSGPVDLGFEIDFAGTDYSQLYVSNKGNVTFDAPHGDYWRPGGSWWPEGTFIAPYFSDVYTASAGSVIYGNTTFDGHLAFGASWIDVPGFGSGSLRNSFQLLIVDRSDVSAGDFDFIFNYDRINWEDRGVGSFVGYGSSIGYGSSSYDFRWKSLYGFPTETHPGVFLTITDINQLPRQSLNSDVAGRFIFEVRDGVVSPGLPAVPEPETWGMMLLGLGLLRVASRRRRVAGKQ